MKGFLTILFITLTMALSGQKLEAYAGLNLNQFYDYNNNGGNYIASFDSGLGPVIGIGIDSVRVDLLKFRFTIQYDRVAGKLDAYEGGHMYSHQTVAEIKKSMLSLGIFPLSFKVIKKIDLNFGVQLSLLLSESVNGTDSGWSQENGSYEYDLQDVYDRYSSIFSFGLTGRIAYDFKLPNSYYISPQYSFYYGLTNEFVDFPEETKSIRHYFCIGVEKRLK
jgi:hypothetical protein